MYVTGYKAKLKKDTSYKGLWTVSFTLEGDVVRCYNGRINRNLTLEKRGINMAREKKKDLKLYLETEVSLRMKEFAKSL